MKGLKCMQCKSIPAIVFFMFTLCPVHLFWCCPDTFLAPWCRLLAQNLHKKTQNVSGQFQHVFDHFETHLGWANRHPKAKKKQAVLLVLGLQLGPSDDLRCSGKEKVSFWLGHIYCSTLYLLELKCQIIIWFFQN